MSSKFIKNSRVTNRPKSFTTPVPDRYEWYSMGDTKENREEEKQHKEYKERQRLEKERIESIPLEELSFRDIYKLPFHQAKYGNWVYDVNSNFIFQFEFSGEDTRKKVIDILNGDLTEYKRQDVDYKEGVVTVDGIDFILIRGWGNLTGVGAYNLSGECAGKIQDTLAEYIVEKLK